MNERLNFLVEKYLNDLLSVEEWEELRALLQATERVNLDPALEKLFDMPRLPLVREESLQAKAAVYEALQGYMEAGVPEEIYATGETSNSGSAFEMPTRSKWGLPVWLRYAAAVIILGSTAWGAYSIWGKKTSAVAPLTPLTAEATKGKLLPPVNAGAVLTLANGAKVALTPNAKLPAVDGSGARLDSGMLVYQDDKGIAAMPRNTFNTLSTSKGMQFQVLLPDGSHVWLNSASSIKYPLAFDTDKREVELSGQAYFEIAPDKSKPFVVKTDHVQVDVLGTSFDVMAYGDEPQVQTTLFHGAVRVNVNKDKSLILEPGQQASWSADAGTLKSREANLDVVGAWRKGLFLFKKASLQEIMRQIARWYDVDVDYQGMTPDISFTGVLSRKEDARQLLDILEATNNVHFITKGNKITVTP